MLDDPHATSNDLGFYRISFRGSLPEDLFDIFEPMQVHTTGGETVLLGAVQDQAALQGVLSKIQWYGLELEEVKLVRNPQPPRSLLKSGDQEL